MAAEEQKKKDRPQNKNLRPITSRTPEERHAICSKGGTIRAQQRRERMTLNNVAKAFMTLGVGKSAAIDPETLKTLGQAEAKSIPIIMDLLLTEYQRYKETGDKESRDFLLRAFGKPEDLDGIVAGTINPDATDADGVVIDGGVRIHLIRGDKAADEAKAKKDAATQNGGEAE